MSSNISLWVNKDIAKLEHNKTSKYFRVNDVYDINHVEKKGFLKFSLVGFYGISILVGYLMLNPHYTYILNI